ncbi:MAG: hypothetical protein ACK4NF_05390 [Planctomycetota bacterium]
MIIIKDAYIDIRYTETLNSIHTYMVLFYLPYIIFQYLILWEYEESGKNIGGIEGKQEKVR